MKAAEEAKAHIKEAEKALGTSWWSLKCRSDLVTASMEYSQAATKFRAASMLPEAVKAWAKAADLYEQQHDLWTAGRAYESAGTICDGAGPGGPSAAVEHWQDAIRCFKLVPKAETAVKLLLKVAELQERQGQLPLASAAFREAIEVYAADEEKDYELADVFKQYIGFLVRSQMTEEALKAIDEHIEVLRKQKKLLPMIHKELLSKVVLLIHLQDTVRAQEVLQSGANLEGWLSCRESKLGESLVEAFQANDAAGAEEVLQDQLFGMLQIEVARLAKTLRVPQIQVSVPPEDGGGGDGQAEPQNLAALLM